MNNKKLAILNKLSRNEITVESAYDSLFGTYIDNSTHDTPVIKHFRDESGHDRSYDSSPMGRFSDD